MPPELEPILKDPGVIEAMVAVVIAVLTAVAALLGFGVKRLRDLQKLSTETKEQVAVTKEQVTNNHDTNLRDDVTDLKILVTDGFRRMDNLFGESHDRQVITDRRIESVESNARQENERIWKALEKKEETL